MGAASSSGSDGPGSLATSSGLTSTGLGPPVDLQLEEALARIRRGEVQNAVLTGLLLGPPEVEELCRAVSFTESVKALELDGSMIGSEGAVRLGDALARDGNINLVDLTNNSIGDAGATALAARLGSNCALRHLDLTRNTIKGDGGVALGRMLTVNGGIRQLTVSENSVGAEGARAIGSALPDNSSLQILNLRQCDLGPEGARFIAQGLNKNASLTELSLGLNSVADDGAAGFAETIRVNRSMRELYLEDNGIEGSGAELMAEALRSNDCLESLWMVGNVIGIDVVAKFARAGAQSMALRRLGLSCPDGSLPPAVLEDLKRVRRRMVHRKHARTSGMSPGKKAQDLAGVCKEAAGSRSRGLRGPSPARMEALWRTWSPHEAPPERGPRTLDTGWDDELECPSPGRRWAPSRSRSPREAPPEGSCDDEAPQWMARHSPGNGGSLGDEAPPERPRHSPGSGGSWGDEARGPASARDEEVQGPAGAREETAGSRSPREAPPQRARHIVVWDDGLQVDELVVVHATRDTRTVDLSPEPRPARGGGASPAIGSPLTGRIIEI